MIGLAHGVEIYFLAGIGGQSEFSFCPVLVILSP